MVAKENGVYKCSICGNVVSVIEANAGQLVCCGQPMDFLEEMTSEQEGKEKHVPVIEPIEKGVRVKVGSVPHPMEEKHYIELIELVLNGNVIASKRLKPGGEPVAEFCFSGDINELKARELCNIHGLWKN